MHITPDIAAALTMLWQGMVGIFAVIGVIALIVYVLGKIANSN